MAPTIADGDFKRTEMMLILMVRRKRSLMSMTYNDDDNIADGRLRTSMCCYYWSGEDLV